MCVSWCPAAESLGVALKYLFWLGFRKIHLKTIKILGKQEKPKKQKERFDRTKKKVHGSGRVLALSCVFFGMFGSDNAFFLVSFVFF